MKLTLASSMILLYAGLSAMPHAQAAGTVGTDVSHQFGAAAETLGDTVEALATAIQVGDRASVAAMFRYPVKPPLAGECARIRNEAELLACYEQVLTPEVAGVIVSQQLGDLTVDEKGVSYTAGALHLRPRCLSRDCERSFWLIDKIYPSGSKPAIEDAAGSS